MNIEQFDEILREAARNVDRGPMNGFDGFGSSAIFARLPKPVQQVYEGWHIPRAILNGGGASVRDYAERCGINVERSLETVEVEAKGGAL